MDELAMNERKRPNEKIHIEIPSGNIKLQI
jgi:hypothetical protein